MRNVICTSAEFEGSYPRFVDLPKPGTPKALLPEVALLGRSNVGKSTLLNTLVQRKKLARSGKTPGVTRAINIFLAEFQSGKSKKLPLRIVDLPGFGFAKVSAKEQSLWVKELGEYLRIRDSLKLVLLLIDSRRGLQDAEFDIIRSLDKPIGLVLTKTDQVKRNELQNIIRQVTEETGNSDVFPVSSEKSIGVTELRSAIYDFVER
jgi:GTP-binding protein